MENIKIDTRIQRIIEEYQELILKTKTWCLIQI